MAALALIAILVTWLGLWGPLSFDKLKEWQTLLAAIIAPSIALYAATLAYRGAMAKVEFDRELARHELIAKKLGLLLRLRHAVDQLAIDIDVLMHMWPTQAERASWLDPNSQERGRTIHAASLKVSTLPAEIVEAWEKLELLPAEAIFPLLTIKKAVPDIRSLHDSFAEDKTWYIDPFRRPPAVLQIYIDACRELRVSVRELVGILDDTIERFRAVKPIA